MNLESENKDRKRTTAETIDWLAHAFRSDRDRLFRTIDAMVRQPKYKDKLKEIEEIAEIWRNIPQEEYFPNINHPRALPEWFPQVLFTSHWKQDAYITNNEINELRKSKK